MSKKIAFKKISLVQKLLLLKLPKNDFVIFGSTPMVVHGLKKRIRDIDVVARGKAWEKAKSIETFDKNETHNGQLLNFFGNRIQVANRWLYCGFDTDELIDRAMVVGGIRFARLENVLAYKKERYAPKDKRHIKLIERYLAANEDSGD